MTALYKCTIDIDIDNDSYAGRQSSFAMNNPAVPLPWLDKYRPR